MDSQPVDERERAQELVRQIRREHGEVISPEEWERLSSIGLRDIVREGFDRRDRMIGASVTT